MIGSSLYHQIGIISDAININLERPSVVIAVYCILGRMTKETYVVNTLLSVDRTHSIIDRL